LWQSAPSLASAANAFFRRVNHPVVDAEVVMQGSRRHGRVVVTDPKVFFAFAFADGDFSIRTIYTDRPWRYLTRTIPNISCCAPSAPALPLLAAFQQVRFNLLPLPQQDASRNLSRPSPDLRLKDPCQPESKPRDGP
jgi:hypothetical protein